MARSARLVIPGHPHHVIQRGVRGMDVFLGDGDYETYLGLLHHWCGEAGTELWAYCLMPNHVHLILTPSDGDGLRAALGETHRRYSRHVNRREGWTGHLWQERFHSFAMDERYLLACARYVELNPVRAGLAKRPEDWAWSSARAHLAGTSGKSNGAAVTGPLLSLAPDWRGFLDGGLDDGSLEAIRRHGRSGRPLGSDAFLGKLETELGRSLRSRRPGRPKSAPAAAPGR